MKIQTRTASVLDTGQLRDIVYLIPPTDTQTGREIVRTWETADQRQVFARVDPGGNAREIQQLGITYDNIITVYIRWFAGLNDNWRLVFRGDNYTIHKDSDINSAQRFYKLTCYTKNKNNA